jgi:FkbM family methyltransferase
VLRKLRRLLEGLLSGVNIYGFDRRILQIIPKVKRKEAWFSYPSIIREITEEYKVDLIIDVGANKGQFTKEIRKLYKGPIFSFEPVSSVFIKLKSAAAPDKNWYVFNYALGNESKEQYINVNEPNEMSSFLEIDESWIEHFNVKGARLVRELIHLRRFVDIMGELPFDISSKKIFLKMDTQGYDLEVFKGASNIVKHLVALQSEVATVPIYKGMPTWTDTIHEYEKAGFRLAGLYPIFRNGLEYIESDCLMVKAP